MKSLYLTFLALTPLSAAYAQEPVNLALKKTYTTSDLNTYVQWTKGLTDGIWRVDNNSIFATGPTPTFPKTATIDLETPASIGYIGVGVPPFGSTKTITLAVSTDNATFSDVGTYVFSQKKEERHLFSFPAVTARYVRLTYVDRYADSVMFPVNHAFTSEVAVYAPGPAPVLPPVLPPETTDTPSPKWGEEGKISPSFQRLHENFLTRGKGGPIGVLFIGDSITAGWGQAKDIWQKYFGAYNPANFGIGGDRTQHVLWRIQNGELDGITPKVAVLMIGTNNSGDTPENITKGVKKVVEQIQVKLPNTKLLLLGIFPRSDANNPVRVKLKTVNAELAKLDDGAKVRYLDIGDKFLSPDGSISKDIMPDLLHPNVAGYQIWADAIQPSLDEMMK